MQKQPTNFFGTPILIGNRTKLYSNEILFFEGDINYSWIHFKSGKQKVIARTLLHIEQQTEAETFVRISRKHLVNRKFIKEIKKGFVVLSNKTVLPIARRRKGVLCTEI
ncbi:MAG: LytTR family transcriptional regulator [Arcicella sp.]|jgi:DNA-binding LytR/AlgR family response regulator|nr:LytTR family transcriptional regulator [Arcicella sp.]